METIGLISLNISLVIYCIYFIPQIIYNQMIKKTEQISLVTQSLMILANICDLIYGFYLFMPWQYKFVTILSLGFLLIQQIQIGLKQYKNLNFIGISVLLIFLLFVAINIISNESLPLESINLFGLVTNFIYWFYWIPQIIYNYKNKQADGFSLTFLSLILLASVCDAISAITLSWNYPSIIGPFVIIILVTIVLAQRKHYKSTPLKNEA
ncbi:PQ-loop repeat-containing protein [Thiotrichales bacterium 19S9-12]|nr:PQ-loop repeat-containing protein [Thiotrichales bacterium 19S9-11]MCF6811325.1 PQ-loop repeat-containing protein [Thiotrichales bacterium 19S9-12]